MKKLLAISGFVFGVIAVVIAVTPLYNLSIIPCILAIICLGLLWYVSKKKQQPSKFIQYIGILVIVAISMSIYKTMFNENEVKNVEELEQKEEDSVEDSIEILEDLEIDE